MATLNYLLFGLLFTLFLQAIAIDKDVATKRIDEMEDPNTLYESNRGLFDLFDLGVGSLRAKCSAVVNRPSTVLPNLGVVLTRLANNRVYFFSQTAANFATARQFCAEHGMHLVTINSETENSLVFARAQALGIAGVGGAPGAWIGYRDVGVNTWRWVQDNSASPFQFFNALPAAGTCANYRTVATGGTISPTLSWVGTNCGTALNFICELEPPCSTVLLANRV